MAKKKQTAPAPVAAGDVMDLKEAAEFLKVSKPTFYRWLAEGKIKGAKVGQQWRFQRQDLESFLQSDPSALPSEGEGFRAAVEADRARRKLEPLPWLKSEDEEGELPRFVDALMKDAVRAEATDIHIDVDRHEARVRYRIDGVLQEVLSFPREAAKAVVARWKVMADMDINERRLPQDGRIHAGIEGKEYDFRVTTVPAVFGESLIARILDQSSVLIGLDRLGLTDTMRAQMEAQLKRPQGLFLLTGVAGSGRTTTAYSILETLNSPQRKIVTIEDPVEYQLRGLMQVHVNRKAGLLPAAALRTFMRCDPDVILVGELRDPETAVMCAQAAMTGHLVLAVTLGTDTASTVTRLVDMGLEPFLVSSSLITVLGQILVRRTCPECQEKYAPSRDLLGRLEAQTGLRLAGAKFTRGRGCKACHGWGYRGRLALFELMAVDEALREVIARPASTAELRDAARTAGMITLLQDGVEKAAAGLTTLEEVIRVLSAGRG